MRKLILTLYQHAWSAEELEPDGASYGSKAEAEAAQIRTARERVETFDSASIIEAHGGYYDDPDRLAELNALDFGEVGEALTDQEAMDLAKSLDGYESAVYPISVEVAAEQVLSLLDGVGHQYAEAALLAIQTQADVTAAALIETGVCRARQVMENWEHGDLAGAVNRLRLWADDVQGALPGLDYASEEEDA